LKIEPLEEQFLEMHDPRLGKLQIYSRSDVLKLDD
jgi:hypothetical protein